jgi:hypothetical protein
MKMSERTTPNESRKGFKREKKCSAISYFLAAAVQLRMKFNGTFSDSLPKSK